MGVPYSLRTFVSFSVNRKVGRVPSGPGAAASRNLSREACSARRSPSSPFRIEGFGQYPSPVRPQDQVLRN